MHTNINNPCDDPTHSACLPFLLCCVFSIVGGVGWVVFFSCTCNNSAVLGLPSAESFSLNKMYVKLVLCAGLCVHLILKIAKKFHLKVMNKITATVGFILFFLKCLNLPGNCFNLGSSGYWYLL